MKHNTQQSLLNSITFAIFLSFSAHSFADGFSLNDANTKNIKKEKWLCKYCPTPSSSTVKVTTNLSNKHNNNGRFSTNVGDSNEGTSGHIDTNIEKRVQDKHYQLLANGLGKDNRNVKVLAAKTSSYKATLHYETLNQFGHDSGLTPYINTGDSFLQLPETWQRVATTSEMVIQNFNGFSEKIERESWQLKVNKQFTEKWQGYIDIQNQNKQGINTTSGNILNKVVILPTGIDQNHQQYDVGSYFAYEYGTLLLNYYKSDFNNKRSVINWDSPYSVLFGGANIGQISTAPDNQFDQISFFGNYHNNNLNFQARFNYGQLSQTDSFLPYSNNSLLSFNSLPSNNLGGEIDTLSTRVKVQYKTENKWKITFNYHLDDRDNNTVSNQYQRILTDSVVLDKLALNKPYSFKKTKVNLYSQYRFAIGSQLTLGWQLDERERNLQDRKESKNQKYWLKVSTRFAPFNAVTFQLSSEFRDGSLYNRTDQTTPVHDELALQKYYQAEREREQAKGRLSFNPFSESQTRALMNTEVSFQAYFSRDKYQKNEIGLIESKRRGIDLSISTSLNKHLSLVIYTHNQWQDNISQGSYWFNSVDWLSNQDDKSDSAGINLIADKLMNDKLTIGMDYSYSYAMGRTHVNTTSLVSIGNHNELVINAQDIKLYADYIYSPDLNLHFDILYQQFDEQDWRFEYDMDRIVNVLDNGFSAYNFDSYRLTTGMTYQF